MSNITASRKGLDSRTLAEDSGVDPPDITGSRVGVPQISSSRRVNTCQGFGYIPAKMPSPSTPEQLAIVESELCEIYAFHPTAVGKYAYIIYLYIQLTLPLLKSQLTSLTTPSDTSPTVSRLKQVKQWFDNERKKVDAKGETLYTCNGPADPNAALRLARMYKKDPEFTVRGLVEGRINGVTGMVDKEEEV
ncbi:hypothetical protein IFR05_005802 [Cadophora sp. M221]|nr:hypothetical protein IFR05_005802 [Cadophora sp. M221]